MENSEETVYDVAVIGCGPVGLVLTHLLAQQGLSVVALERYQTILEYPRAAHLNDEIMRIFQTMGLAQELEPTFGIPVGLEYYDQDWNLFFSFDTTHMGRREQGWYDDYMFYQPDFERRLHAALSKFPQVHMMLGAKVVEVTPNEQSVLVRTRMRETETMQDVRARYVVGCDGANSFVRGVIGSSQEDLHGTQRWMIVDIKLQRDVPLPKVLFEYCHPTHTVTYVPVVGPYRRFDFKVTPDEPSEELERPERVWEMLQPWLQPGDAEIMRADVYEFHGMLTHGWRKGRLLIAGDAAHLMPPMLGQGLNSGLRDAMNLAWKLALVIRGSAPERVLDTYETERAPHVRELIQTSIYLAKMIEHMANARDTSALAGKPAFTPPRPALGPGLIANVVAPAGTLSAQPKLADGRLLDDAVGYAFAIIGKPALVQSVSPITRARWQAIGAVVIEVNGGELADWLTRLQTSAVVLRPDRYILGVASDTSTLEELTAQLATNLLTHALLPASS